MTFVNKIRSSFMTHKRSTNKDNNVNSKLSDDHETAATAEDSLAFSSSSLNQDQHGDSLDRALELCERGCVLDSEADFSGAFGCFVEAITVMEKINVQEQSALVTKCETYERMAFIMYKREDYANAKTYFEKAQDLRRDYPHTDTSKREEIEYLMEMVEMML